STTKAWAMLKMRARMVASLAVSVRDAAAPRAEYKFTNRPRMRGSAASPGRPNQRSSGPAPLAIQSSAGVRASSDTALYAGATRQRFADVVHPSTPSRKIERNAGLSSTNISIDAPRGSVKWARAPRAAGKNRPFCGSPPPAAVLYNAGEVMAVRMLRRKPQPSLLLRARTAALGLLAGLAVLLTGCFPLLPAVTGDPPETGGATGQLLITVHAAGLTAETFHRPLETLRVTLT